jgi:hypothetical protein
VIGGFSGFLPGLHGASYDRDYFLSKSKSKKTTPRLEQLGAYRPSTNFVGCV